MRAGNDIRHLTLHLMRDDLPRAGLALARLHAFAPDSRDYPQEPLDEVPGEGFSECIAESRSHYERLYKLLHRHLDRLPAPPPPGPGALEREKLLAQQTWLKQAWAGAGLFETAQHQIIEQLRELKHLKKSLTELSGLKLDLGELHNTHRFLDLHIGVAPSENLNSLRQALALSGHIIIRASREAELSRILIGGPRRQEQEIQDVLTAAGFHPLEIPDDFHSDPQQLATDLAKRRERLAEKQLSLNQALESWVAENGARLLEAKAALDAAMPYVAVGNAAHSKGNLAAIHGWLSAEHLPLAQHLLENHLQFPFLLEQRQPQPDEYPLVPIPPANHRWLRPFSLLVQQYGVPRFGELDPTWLFSLSFCLMFGMMFGDVGHGAVFIASGLLLRRRLGNFTPPLVIAGASSVVFGFLYGSVFGVEHWIHPLWIAPLSDPTLMLAYALGWGVAFITLGSIIAIGNRLLAEDFSGALFDPGGVFSLTLYLSLISGLVSLLRGQAFNPVSLLILLLSLGFLLYHLWQSSRAPWGERLLTVAIEAFEMVTGYFSNTLSFLRVAAFSLNHVALSLAIFTLADMMGTTGQLLTLLLGNLFVMVLEGAIVAIQILRLEYYEGFSRFFHGDGKPFIPLKYGPAVTRQTPT